MDRRSKLAVALLFISTIIGLVRGFRLIHDPGGESVIYPYPNEMIEISVFSNYVVLGWVIFLLIGVFSLLTLLCRGWRPRWFAYMVIMEGIFVTCLSTLNVIVGGFSFVHILAAVVGLGLIVMGVLLAPREF